MFLVQTYAFFYPLWVTNYFPGLTLHKPSVDTTQGCSFWECTLKEMMRVTWWDQILTAQCLLIQETHTIDPKRNLHTPKEASLFPAHQGIGFLGFVPHFISVTTLLMNLFEEGSNPCSSWIGHIPALKKIRLYPCYNANLLQPHDACFWKNPTLLTSVRALFSQMNPRPVLPKPPWG